MPTSIFLNWFEQLPIQDRKEIGIDYFNALCMKMGICDIESA